MSAPEDDSTVLRTGGSFTGPGGTVSGPPAGASSSGPGSDGLSLPVGARVAEFEVTAQIGEGGFSIVYLAKDHSLERVVALKEYMPSSLASRTGITQVQPRSQRYRDTFDLGLKSFVNEAKLLAQFDHPALVKVYRFWEANGTAYMVMPYYQGSTVKDTIRAMPEPPDEAWLMALLAPLTEALTVIHGQQCYHRDIAPDNVILLAGSGNPLLLDFGAARRVIGDMTQALTVILKAGYAPVEQYAEVPGMKQGPWTDVYALAAVVYWAITGKTPPPSVGRMVNDSHVPLMECAAGRYSPRFLQAIDRALVVLPDQRTQSIEALRRDLGIDAAAPPPVSDLPWSDSDATVIRPSTRTEAGRNTVTAASIAGVPVPPPESVALPGLGLPPEVAQPNATVHAAKATKEPDHARSGVKPALVVGAALVLGVAGLGLWWGLGRSGTSAPPAPPPAPSSSVTTRPTVQPAVDAPPAPANTMPAPPTLPGQPPAPTPPTPSPAPDPIPPTPPEALPGTDTRPPAFRPPAPKPSAPVAGVRPRPETKPPQKPPVAENSPECAAILAKLSLGEPRPELLDRYKQLNCR